MPKKKRHLNHREVTIIKALHEHGGLMTAHEISEITGLSYVTVRKYLERLAKEGIIKADEKW